MRVRDFLAPNARFETYKEEYPPAATLNPDNGTPLIQTPGLPAHKLLKVSVQLFFCQSVLPISIILCYTNNHSL